MQGYGERVRLYREAVGISQELLADRAHMEKSKISRIETGDRALKFEEAVSIASALGISLYDLAGVQPMARHLHELTITCGQRLQEVSYLVEQMAVLVGSEA